MRAYVSVRARINIFGRELRTTNSQRGARRGHFGAARNRSESRSGRRQGKRNEENGFQYPVKGIAKIRILARFTSMVIICEDPSRSMRAAREREKDRIGEGSRALEREREREG